MASSGMRCCQCIGDLFVRERTRNDNFKKCARVYKTILKFGSVLRANSSSWADKMYRFPTKNNRRMSSVNEKCMQFVVKRCECVCVLNDRFDLGCVFVFSILLIEIFAASMMGSGSLSSASRFLSPWRDTEASWYVLKLTKSEFGQKCSILKFGGLIFHFL